MCRSYGCALTIDAIWIQSGYGWVVRLRTGLLR